MKIIKRSGAENTFDKEKIENAVAKANITVEEKDRLSEGEIGEIAQNIEDKCSEMNRAMDVETIQDWVEADIMRHGKYTVAVNAKATTARLASNDRTFGLQRPHDSAATGITVFERIHWGYSRLPA